MSDFFEKTFYNNTLAEWGLSLLIILGSIVLGKVLYWAVGKFIKKLTRKTKTRLDDLMVDMLEEPVIFALTIAGIWIGVARLDFGEGVDNWIEKVFYVLITINVTWLLSRVVDALIEEYIVPITEKSESDLDDQLIPIIRKGLRVTIWILGIITALNNAGFNVGALVAGLGIGGIGLALAAKDSVSNFFGGITVFADKPFKIGDRVQIGGYDGTIEEIGLRSSRLRTLPGRLVTIPNSQFIDSMVENVSNEPARRIYLNLGLVYGTSADKMEEAMAICREIAESNPKVENEIKLGFDSFGDFSLGINFSYYINKGEINLEIQSAINLAILRKFEAAGLEMAFPTQTVYHIKGD